MQVRNLSSSLLSRRSFGCRWFQAPSCDTNIFHCTHSQDSDDFVFHLYTMVKSGIILLTLITLLSNVPTQVASLDFSLKILHINDHHSHLPSETFSIPAAKYPQALRDLINVTAVPQIQVTYGGFPLLIPLFDSIAKASGTPVLKLHAGDALTGTLYFNLFEGKADSDLMKFICFDAFTLGNHEFDSGDLALSKFLSALKDNTACPNIPVLSANLAAGDASPIKALVLPYVIREFNAEKVAIIGLTTELTASSSSPDKGTIFRDTIQAAQTAIANVTAMGVNKIVMLTHVGYDVDVSLVAQLDGVDVIVGGHTHSLLGQNVDLLKTADGPFPTVVTKTTLAGGKVCVVQAWEYGHGLGELDVVFDATGNVLSCSGGPKFAFTSTGYSPVLNTTTAKVVTDYLLGTGAFVAVEPNTEAKAVVDSLTAQVSKFGDEVIATVTPPGICVSSSALSNAP